MPPARARAPVAQVGQHTSHSERRGSYEDYRGSRFSDSRKDVQSQAAMMHTAIGARLYRLADIAIEQVRGCAVADSLPPLRTADAVIASARTPRRCSALAFHARVPRPRLDLAPRSRADPQGLSKASWPAWNSVLQELRRSSEHVKQVRGRCGPRHWSAVGVD